MLVLARRVGEKIVVNGNITITVSDIRGGVVKIGVDAPPEVPILREELREAMNTPSPVGTMEGE